ncbi:MAG: glycoside hydrolase family 3 protein, partial [Alphaproteobacteria bacterium]|nr:glycoside hydrolase family 3 protein [Alphaproteobacteria bacterium]
FAPFRALKDAPLGLTAHVCFSAIDEEHPATLSERVIADIIRGEIGFDGLLFSDDLSMGALQGDVGSRAARSLAAGCDIALHCNGSIKEMEAVVAAVPRLSAEATARWDRAVLKKREKTTDISALKAELESLLNQAGPL